MTNFAASISLRDLNPKSIREFFERNPDAVLNLDANELGLYRALKFNAHSVHGGDLRDLAKLETREDFARYDYRPGLGFALTGIPGRPRSLVLITWDPYWKNTVGIKVVCKDVRNATEAELRLTRQLADILKTLDVDLLR